MDHHHWAQPSIDLTGLQSPAMPGPPFDGEHNTHDHDDMLDMPELQPIAAQDGQDYDDMAFGGHAADVDVEMLLQMQRDDDEDSLPDLQSQSDSEPDSDFDADAEAVEMMQNLESVEEGHYDLHSLTNDNANDRRESQPSEQPVAYPNDDFADMPPLEPLAPTTPQPQRGNRRARGADDDDSSRDAEGDEERDRRHPSQRVPPANGIVFQLGTIVVGQDRREGTQEPVFFFQHMFRPEGSEATPAPTDNAAPPTGPPSGATALPPLPIPPQGEQPLPPHEHLFSGVMAFQLDAAGNGIPLPHMHMPNAPAPPNTDEGAQQQDQQPRPQPQPRPFPAFLDDFFQMIAMQEPPEDPERAKKLVNGLEEVSVGLITRMERVGGVPGGHVMTVDEQGTTAGCAICWDTLLDANGGFKEKKNEPESANLPESSTSAPTTTPKQSPPESHPRIVALPCAHVFHADCLIPWFSRPKKPTCPTCRFNIDPENLTLRRMPHPMAMPPPIPLAPGARPTQMRNPFWETPRPAQAAPGTPAAPTAADASAAPPAPGSPPTNTAANPPNPVTLPQDVWNAFMGTVIGFMASAGVQPPPPFPPQDNANPTDNANPADNAPGDGATRPNSPGPTGDAANANPDPNAPGGDPAHPPPFFAFDINIGVHFGGPPGDLWTPAAGPTPAATDRRAPGGQRARMTRPPPDKQWTLPPAPGPTLRQWVEDKEREIGLRCFDVSCGVGPCDEEPGSTVEMVRQLLIQPGTDGSTAHESCGHTFHAGCLVSAERVAGWGRLPELEEGDSDVRVPCPVCRTPGRVSRKDWEEGVNALG